MKKHILLLSLALSLIFLFTNCNNKELKRLQALNDSIMAVGYQKDTTVMEFVRAFNEIQSNLDSIKLKENIISQSTSHSGELQTNAKDQINSDVNAIYNMLKKNRQLLDDMRAKLKNTESKNKEQIAELTRMIDNINKQLEQKNAEIATLKADLERANIKVQDMNIEMSELSKNISAMEEESAAKDRALTEKEEQINTAYYIIGTTDELKEMGIITRKGGFLGMGKKTELNKNFNASLFTKVNVHNLTELPIYKNNVAILTVHPSNSYEIVREEKKAIEKIQIRDAKDFWSTSKYLVIVAE